MNVEESLSGKQKIMKILVEQFNYYKEGKGFIKNIESKSNDIKEYFDIYYFVNNIKESFKKKFNIIIQQRN